MSSLRERRRKRTAETICLAAIDLAYERGLDNVTTEMISDAAGISARTFFNYFPYKEAAFVPPPLAFQQVELEKFLKSENSLLEDVIALFISEMDDVGLNRDYMLKLHKIALDNPKLMNLRMAAFHEYEKLFAALVRQRLGCAASDIIPMQVAAVTMATIRVVFDNWIEFGQGTLADNVPKQLRAISHIFEIPE